MELRQVGNKTYYIEHDTNIGIYNIEDNKICLIDTGSAGDGEKIDEIITNNGWELKYILNTHTHIDHIGGNKYLIEKYGVHTVLIMIWLSLIIRNLKLHI